MARYTVHEPGTDLKRHEYARLTAAFARAYRYLPLDPPGRYNLSGRYVTVQEWDDDMNPLRQWMISGKR
jgi:hypothetical protein